MIHTGNLKALVTFLGFESRGHIFSKSFKNSGTFLGVDFQKETFLYPETEGLRIHERQTCNFTSPENAVVFECVYQLLQKGYKPKHIELEPKWKLGHGASGGRADILVKDQNDQPLLILECKTYGREFEKAWKETYEDGGQLFSYAQQIAETQFLCLYASIFDSKTNRLLTQQRIISHTDNKTILELSESPKSYQKASNVKMRFEVWKETYQREYTETGIFEETIEPYHIGKNHYTLESDTRPVTQHDKEGKYHRFRTILRQHNIARKETAFEVLVNLFLAKIVDEEENRHNLKFYWKGMAYDNYYDFVDRLQQLYQIGMRKFLKDDVMYISSKQIDEAFWTVKNRRNATKKQIQKYFRDLKFFSNNAFSLFSVHNEMLFNKNTKVLVELVQMWQTLRLKTKEQNQFLGDMFEYFLDNSIKQSEGQFFTPIPITKFIVSSLPLKQYIKNTSEPLKAIDYACGAGHFLTEYAHQIEPWVTKYKQTDVRQYYEQIIGVEKEDRLAKIAKVSAYMYGQDQIKVIEEDALGDCADLQDASFDILVANPPFSVEGFLLNLTDAQKARYELLKTTESNSNTNTIQCFFIERAKQLMASRGVAGIIVPSSILSNADGTHIATREILLKYFDIIALVELGGGTFGKTGTTTVVLFLRRKHHKPEPAEHYQNRVDDYFENPLSGQLEGKERLNTNISEYQDVYLIQKYCQHNNLPFEAYITLFGITPKTLHHADMLLKTERFKEYQKVFYQSTDIKNLQKKKSFKAQSKDAQEYELRKRLIAYLHAIEKDKLYYFMLASENPEKVLIVRSPSSTKEKKQFLGYEWSGAKGSEGIKYHGGGTVGAIQTPLFNPSDTQDQTKINYLIKQNFLGNPPCDLSEFKKHTEKIHYADMVDLLDFGRTDFNKAFSLGVKRDYAMESKWELVALGDIVETLNGLWTGKKEPFIKAKVIRNTNFTQDGKLDLSDVAELNVEQKQFQSRKLKLGDIIIEKSGGSSTQAVGRVVYYDINDDNFSYSNFTSRLRVKTENIHSKYLYLFLNRFYELGYTFDFQSGSSGIKNLNFDLYLSIKIPLPPLEVQRQIAKECDVVDTQSATAQHTIDEAREEIERKIDAVQGKRTALKELSIINPSKSEIKDLDPKTILSFVEMESVSNDGYIEKMVDKPYKDLKKSSYTYFAENDIIIAKITPSMENGKCALAKNLSNKLAMGSSEFHVIRVLHNLIPKYAFLFLNRDEVRKEAEQVMTGSSGHRRVPKSFYANLTIPIPPLSKQNELVEEIEILEQSISRAQEILQNAPSQKQEILDRYLT
jgi:type I restriction enzyme M protein